VNPTSLARLAKKSPCHQRHVAIIVRGGAIIAYATNTLARHAEVRALKEAGSRAAGATLFSMRLTPAGRIGNAMPCQDCWQAIGEAGSDLRRGSALALDIQHREAGVPQAS